MSLDSFDAQGDVKLGRWSKIHPSVRLVATPPGCITLAPRCHLKSGVIVNAYGGLVKFEGRVTVGEYSVVYGHGGVLVGEGTAIAPHVVISAQEHILDSDFPVRFSGETARGIVIGSNCLISARSVILDGVSLGDGCVIGAGAVVTRSMPAGYVCVGNPCRPVRRIESNKSYGHEA